MSTAFAVDGFVAALFVLFGVGVVAQRQMLSTLYLFMAHAAGLTASTVVLAVALGRPHLYWVAAITFVTKVVIVPLVLRWSTGAQIYTRREVDQVLTIPRSILIAGALALVAWIVAQPLVAAASGHAFAVINLPTGLMAVFFGAFTVANRREAVAQLMGILIMESGAYFAAIAIVDDLSVLVEIAAAVDIPIAALVIGLLIRSIRHSTGTTRAGLLADLKEHGR